MVLIIMNIPAFLPDSITPRMHFLISVTEATP
jgi:hypothetical protein